MALNDINTQSHSTINPSVCVRGANAVGSQLSVTIEQTSHGFLPGMAIRWNSGIDGATAQYSKAFANSPYNAEVVGIVGNVLTADAFELVMGGVVIMNEDDSSYFGQSIGSGLTADDVYFLSGTTAGHLTPARPNTPGHVAKPLITRLAEDAQGRIYGVVTNYVGSHIGGNAAVSLDNLIPAGTIQAYAGSNAPSGWAICDGDGSKGGAVPGIEVANNLDYYNNVGLRYGWVELLYLKDDELPVSDIGNYIQAAANGKTIAGSIVGVSGSYVFVKQSDNDVNVPNNLNSNFVTYTDENSQNIRTRGAGNEMYSERCIIQNPEIFPRSVNGESARVIRPQGGDEQAILLYQDDSNMSGVFSCLAPDLRGRIIWGAKEPDTFGDGENSTDVLARSGGAEQISLDFETTPDGGQFSGGTSQLSEPSDDGWADSQTNLPPYLTTNWIIRTSSTAYAAITDRLSVKNLLLTGLPTSGDGEDQFTVFRDTTDNSLKIQPDAPS